MSSVVIAGNTSGSVTLAAPDIAGTTTITFPTTTGIPIISVTGVAGVEQGGTGLTSVGTSGNVLTSNGTTWTSTAPSPSLGIGQTWQYPSRAANTTYTNTTGRPMFIVISAWGTGAINVRFELFVNGTLLARDAAFEASGTLGACVSAIIPSGSTYSISNVVGTLTWAELR